MPRTNSIAAVILMLNTVNAQAFATKGIGQSNPLMKASNTLTITIQTDVDLATAGDVITISGLSNAVGEASLALTD
eukprot:2103669-Rhodomonas_salina.1